jgi:hypothetical protein
MGIAGGFDMVDGLTSAGWASLPCRSPDADSMPRREIDWSRPREPIKQTAARPSYQKQAGAAKPVAGQAGAVL